MSVSGQAFEVTHALQEANTEMLKAHCRLCHQLRIANHSVTPS